MNAIDSVQFKRSDKSFTQLESVSDKLQYGEPLYLDTESVLMIGSSDTTAEIVDEKGVKLVPKALLGKEVYFDPTDNKFKNGSNSNITDINVKTQADSDNSTLIATTAYVQNNIDAMSAADPTASGTATDFINSVSQTDGKITATKASLPAASTTVAGIAKLGASGGASTFEHTHGNITNDGKVGSTANYAVYTTTSGVVTAGSLATSAPSASGTATAFITSVSQDSKGKISASKANLPNYAASSSLGGAATNVTSTAVTSGTYYVAAVAGSGSQGVKYRTGVTVNAATGVLMGAAWNDIAEYREGIGEAGQVVVENGKGQLEVSSKHLQKCPYVVSDTFGFAIGETEKAKTPVAISGRVLVNYRGTLKVGDAVCAGKYGCTEKMSRLECILFPDRILGIVSEIPEYDIWNKVNVQNRIWIKVR